LLGEGRPGEDEQEEEDEEPAHPLTLPASRPCM
jgi:hypothetical protein